MVGCETLLITLTTGMLGHGSLKLSIKTIFGAIKSSSGELLRYTCLYSPDDALFVRNIYREILWVFIWEMWLSIPIVSAAFMTDDILLKELIFVRGGRFQT